MPYSPCSKIAVLSLSEVLNSARESAVCLHMQIPQNNFPLFTHFNRVAIEHLLDTRRIKKPLFPREYAALSFCDQPTGERNKQPNFLLVTNVGKEIHYALRKWNRPSTMCKQAFPGLRHTCRSTNN